MPNKTNFKVSVNSEIFYNFCKACNTSFKHELRAYNLMTRQEIFSEKYYKAKMLWKYFQGQHSGLYEMWMMMELES